ncbi:reverse transcriptase domain-containing protein [Streptomyces sp. NPDC127033]|uniref:reverse transcriptase domain-containing protein n=1 Tax=Streptomyces sp. NPDC127033 TaxID=3347110 RepID=UPI00365776B4
MPKDAPLNSGALLEAGPVGPRQRVSEMQAKLHRWAVADPGRRFDDLFNLVHDPATLIVAFDRVAGNRGARSPGVDGLTAADVEERFGVPGFLGDLRAQLRQGSFRPLPVRERKIPKPGGSGKVRRLGIPVIADRVVQAALKLVLEPIFEADFKPVSYGFRPKRRAQDAIAEIHFYGTHGYRWVLDADIAACFDEIDHVALMDRVRMRIKDKRVLALVKAFLKSGLLTELGEHQETLTGTPQGGIISPLLANIALSALDEHLHRAWEPDGELSTSGRRERRGAKGLPSWRLVRYADLRRTRRLTLRPTRKPPDRETPIREMARMTAFLFGILSSLAASALMLVLGVVRGSRPLWWLLAAHRHRARPCVPAPVVGRR